MSDLVFCSGISSFSSGLWVAVFLGTMSHVSFMIRSPDSDIVQMLSLFLSGLKPAHQNCHPSGRLICEDVWGRVWQLHPAASPSFKDDLK